MNIIEEGNKVNMLTQGATAAVYSTYFYSAYMAMLPWFAVAVPLILIDLTLGVKRARIRGEDVTLNKAVQLACAKEYIYDTYEENWKTVLRWVVTGGSFYHVQDYVEESLLYLGSGNHGRLLVTDTVNTLTACNTSVLYLSNYQDTVILASDRKDVG